MKTYLSETTTVGWLGPGAPASLPPELGGWELVRVSRNPSQVNVDLLVVETAAFNTLRECERFAAQPACPVLYLTDLAEVADLVNGLQTKDDVCLMDSPPALLANRLAKLQHQQRAMVDPLTGVHRREAFFHYLRQWSLNARQTDPLSLLLMDVDQFKSFNDQRGHQIGDEALQRFGQLLRRECTDSPLIARLGGQEFAVLLPSDARDASVVAEKIRGTVEVPGLMPDCELTVSIGVASRSDVRGLEQLQGVADEALFAAKAAGRNRVCLYSQLTTDSLLRGENPDLVSLENKSRILGQRVSDFVAQRSRRILQDLRTEAETDGLTKFFTRRYLDRRLKLQFQHHQETGRPLSIAMIDIDHFGDFNKRHGWPTGDKTLKVLGDLIRRFVRCENDWVGRYGGEEFIVVLPDVVVDDAVAVCERLRVATESASLTSTTGQPLQLTLSIGVAQCEASDETAAELMERLSKLTLRAKAEGRNRVCWAPAPTVENDAPTTLRFTASAG